MKQWPFQVITYTPALVQKYCVENASWQEFRQSLKGLSTEVKLDKLKEYFERDHSNADYAATMVQVSNYINALKRGGQLDMDLRVQR